MGLMQLLTVGRSLSEARDRPHRFKVLNGAMPTFGYPDMPDMPDMPGRRLRVRINSGERTMESQTTQGEVKDAGRGMNAYPLGRWTLRVNPFKTAPKPARTGVQGELSLEKVKVVRNDLSDSDLELVAVSKQGRAEAKAAATPFGGVALAKPGLWSRIKARLWRRGAR
jgi:hypothetical protein